MGDRESTREQLIEALQEARRRLTELERSDADMAVARDALQESERRSQERFRALAEQTSDWIWEVDENGVYTYCSPKVRELLGYEPDEVIGKTPFDVMPPDEAARVAGLFRSIIDARRPFDGLENTNRHKDGHLVVLETSGVPITNGEGSFAGYRGIDRDITARKEVERTLQRSHDELEQRVEERTRELEQANEELRRSEAAYREIFDSATDMIVVQDIETGEVLDINEETARATGYSRDELMAMGIAGWSPQGEEFAPERAMGYIARAAAGKPQLFEWGFVDAEGNLHPTEVHLKRVTLGGEPRLLGVVRDIGDRRRVEEALQESERRYRALFENMGECVGVYQAVDDGEDFVFCGFNRAAEELEQVERGRLLGRRVTEVFPGVRDLGLLEVFTQVWRTGEPRRHPVSFYQDERLTGWRENHVYKLPSGEVVAVYEDVTERKQAEEELRRSETQLRATFENATDAILWGDPETGLITRCNRAAEELLEKPREEIVGQHQATVHPPARAEHYGQMFRAHIEDHGAFEDEAEVITGSGEIKPVAITASIAVVEGTPILQGVFRDISARKRAEAAVARHSEVLGAINRVFREALACESEMDVCRACLAVAEEITGSAFGFIGEVDDAGRYDVLALSRTGWTACDIPEAEALAALQGMEVRGIWGRAVRDRKPLFTNDATSHPDSVGTPEGHPTIHRFLAVPIERGADIYGLIGLANKASDFDAEDLAALDALSTAFAEALVHKRTEMRVKASLLEKEVLLSEVHHRVKNNLQVISSLLNLQARTVDDAQVGEMFRESRNRVRTMALTHEQLYRSEDLARVDLGRYVRDLAGSLFRSYGVDPQVVSLRLDVGELSLPLDSAIPCGLIINELVSNSLKHAFPDGRRGRIAISLQREGPGQATLRIADDGAGIPEDVDLRETASLGLQLVTSLVDQIQGALEEDRGDGTAFRITFALDEARE